MIVYIPIPQHLHEHDFMQAIAGSLSRLGHDVTHNPKALYGAAIVWNGRDWPGDVPTLYVECGWLPRWWYQVSHRGINAASHLAPLAVPPALTEDERAELATHLEYCRDANPYDWPYLRPSAEPLPDDLPARFVLCPLQMPGDTNMAHVAECRRTPQGLIDWCSEANPALPIVFKMHPAQHTDLPLLTRRPQDMLCPATLTVPTLLASGRVAQVLTANSNTYNDALAYGVPAQAWDAGIWGPKALEAYADHSGYLLALKRAQWSLEDAADPLKVRAALDLAIREHVAPAIEVSDPGPLVNVCLGNRGWLFNDLAQHLARYAPRAGCQVSVTEQPDPAADAYLYMRADEARQCPHPERAVCQVHDQWGNWHKRFDGVKVAGWSLTHPDQYAMLARFVDLHGRRSMLQPLGAPENWKVRPGYDPEAFALAWVGRAVAFKRVTWFAQVCTEVAGAIPGFRAVLLGQNLEPCRDALQEHNVPVELRTKAALGFDAYQGQYHGFDAVVICSDPDGNGDDAPKGEAHPMPLFEAMACGVPVIASHVGWAPWLAPYLFIGQKGLRERVLECYRNRDSDFRRRSEFASLARQFGTLESWCVSNLRFCLEVAHAAK